MALGDDPADRPARYPTVGWAGPTTDRVAATAMQAAATAGQLGPTGCARPDAVVGGPIDFVVPTDSRRQAYLAFPAHRAESSQQDRGRSAILLTWKRPQRRLSEPKEVWWAMQSTGAREANLRPGVARRGRMLAAIVALLTMTLGVLAPRPALAETSADSYEVAGQVAQDGTLSITEKITFSGTAPTFSQQLEKSMRGMDYSVYDFEISDIKVTAGGTDLEPQISDEANYRVITVDGAKAGNRPIEISYQVKGAAFAGAPMRQGDRLTEVRWRVLQGLSVGVRSVSGVIDVGPAFVRDVDCQSGAPAQLTSCDTVSASTFEARQPEFGNGALGAGQVVVMSFKVSEREIAPNEMVRELWTLDRAFSADWPHLLTALGVALLGSLALWLLHRRRGRDELAEPSLVARFEPVGDGQTRFILNQDVRPGEIGTIADERVDPVDVTATILDLAQRGHLRIVELDRRSPHAPLDWALERAEHGNDELLEYEKLMLDALVAADGEPILVSEIGANVVDKLGPIQDAIYGEAVTRGWFPSNPDQVRRNYARIGMWTLIAAFIGLGLLVAFTRFGLTGLVLVGLAVGVIFVAQQMPRRTPAGSSVYHGLQATAIQLQTQPTNQAPQGEEYDELSRILPYAVVLGAQERWLQALADADDDPGVPDPDDLHWYRAPATWQLSDLPMSLDAFITTIEGKLYSRG